LTHPVKAHNQKKLNVPTIQLQQQWTIAGQHMLLRNSKNVQFFNKYNLIILGRDNTQDDEVQNLPGKYTAL